MPGTAVSEPPSVSLSFANNFWGKDDAGVDPLLERMHNAKVTSDELKSFYAARSQIEDEYARKLLHLARKPLGSSEAGTLRLSLDVIKAETESMGKAHQQIASLIKSELEEPLAAFAGGMKERRKIIQTGIEKLLKLKTQQTVAVNKARDRYEQDCLKIKGFLAQAHMVMGQEERKNKAKLEKTQGQLATTSEEYAQAVKILEETTGRWNRDWKSACDKFQDLEEERIDFTKSSLWSFANIASTVCVSDDASCEKMRLSLEDCDVEKDIVNFIKDKGTGQEIPDPPKFIDFCRGDADDVSEASDEYSVAQFQRTMNPAFRTSSPQPSTFESHHDPNNPLVKEMGLRQPTPVQAPPMQQPGTEPPQSRQSRVDPRLANAQAQQQYMQAQYGEIPKIPHNEYPMDGMTQFCRPGPPAGRATPVEAPRPMSRDSRSDYSAHSFSSVEPPSGSNSPGKPMMSPAPPPVVPDVQIQKKKSGFFQGHSPFRRRSKHEKQSPILSSSNRSTWGARQGNNSSPTRNTLLKGDMSASPEPVDPSANFQLNIGNNVFDVASPDGDKQNQSKTETTAEMDPIAQALAELKSVGKQAPARVSADRYAGLATPAPSTTSNGNTPSEPTPTPLTNSALSAAQRGTPPPLYEQQPVSRLGAPQPAFTSRAMQQTTQKYIDQKRNIFKNAPVRASTFERSSTAQNPTSSRPATRNSGSRPSQDLVRASSPAPPRATSPRPSLYQNSHDPQPQSPAVSQYRASSPNPYAATSNPPATRPGSSMSTRPRPQSSSPVKSRPHPDYNYNGTNVSTNSYNSAISRDTYASRDHRNSFSRGAPSPAPSMARPISRAASPNPQFRQAERPTSSRGSDMANAMAVQLAPAPGSDSGSIYGGSQRGRGNSNARPLSGYYGSGDMGGGSYASSNNQVGHVRSRSVAEPRQYTHDGRIILHYARAMYMYQAQIPEELSFAKGDILAVLRLQDDGWWEAEVMGKPGRSGLVPSNYLQAC